MKLMKNLALLLSWNLSIYTQSNKVKVLTEHNEVRYHGAKIEDETCETREQTQPEVKLNNLNRGLDCIWCMKVFHNWNATIDLCCCLMVTSLDNRAWQQILKSSGILDREKNDHLNWNLCGNQQDKCITQTHALSASRWQESKNSSVMITIKPNPFGTHECQKD